MFALKSLCSYIYVLRICCCSGATGNQFRLSIKWLFSMVILMQSIDIDVFFSNVFLCNSQINNDDVVMVLSRSVMSFWVVLLDNWNLIAVNLLTY